MTIQCLEFVLPIEPKAQKRARSRSVMSGGRSFAMTYKDAGQKKEENKLTAMLVQHMPERQATGAVRLGVSAYLPIPASKPKKWKEAAERGAIQPTTKPDLDNIIKHFKDCCKGIFWLDDKQVVGYLEGTGKFYSTRPRYEVRLIMEM